MQVSPCFAFVQACEPNGIIFLLFLFQLRRVARGALGVDLVWRKFGHLAERHACATWRSGSHTGYKFLRCFELMPKL